jgi:vacuolar-type H+-ATPase catalytic subunit A/Vma1
MIQELVLGQSAYDPHDAFSPVTKTYRMASLALAFHHQSLRMLQQGARFEQLELGPARRALAALRAAAPDEFATRVAEAEAVASRASEGPVP